MAFQGTAFFLAGNRYPADSGVEEAICSRLHPALPRVLKQRDWLGETPRTLSVPARLRRLTDAVGETPGPVLIGRSSGGRIATLLAARRPVHAVICLCYPFQAPARILELGRFAHLAQLDVPTLILQGTEDEYGGLEVTERYPLSPNVHLRFLAGVRHAFDLSPAGWDSVARLVLDFITHAERPPAPEAAWFDEADYLSRHPEVATVIASGRFASAHDHYLRQGRHQGRRYRLRPMDGPLATA